MHSQGCRLTLHLDRTLQVATADGTPIRHRPPLPWRPAGQLDPDARIGPSTLPPHTHGDRLDLGYAVSVLLHQAA